MRRELFGDWYARSVIMDWEHLEMIRNYLEKAFCIWKRVEATLGVKKSPGKS